MNKYKEILEFIRSQYPTRESVPLHEPCLGGNAKKYLIETIDSTYVSSVGPFVNLFEKTMADITGARFAIATVNGTSALHMALMVCEVKQNEEVLCQALTFIATANAISYLGAVPVFIDVDLDTLGLSPIALNTFLLKNGEKRSDGYTYNKRTGRRIKACVPMHTFGFPLRIDEIREICIAWNIVLIEDSAESIGSYYKGIHTGKFGKMGVFSFNGNKTITCGGGGAIITDDEELAKRARHLSTQAKVPHLWRFQHDEIGYNYRMPNLNAALACSQFELLPALLKDKKELSNNYASYFSKIGISFVSEIENAKANNWLFAIIMDDKISQEHFLEFSNDNNVTTRPIWDLMNELPMFENCQTDGLINSKWLADRVVNIPSSVRIKV